MPIIQSIYSSCLQRGTIGHTDWTYANWIYDGFTTALPPNTKVLVAPGIDLDVNTEDENNGGPTYAAVTARSYHPGGVNCPVLRRQRQVHQELDQLGDLASSWDHRLGRGRQQRRLLSSGGPTFAAVTSRSDHPGGVNTLFGDGHVKFIKSVDAGLALGLVPGNGNLAAPLTDHFPEFRRLSQFG